MSMVDYLTKMKLLADDMVAASKPLDDEELVGHILTGLPLTTTHWSRLSLHESNPSPLVSSTHNASPLIIVLICSMAAPNLVAHTPR